MHIVILGAGYGGMRAANILGRRLGSRNEAKITLVNAYPRHVLTTELHKVAAGTASPEDVTVRLDRALPMQGLDIRIAQVTRIDPAQQLVFLAEGDSLAYDYLVVALGSTVEYWGIPGLAENAHAIGGLQGAIRIREAVKSGRSTRLPSMAEPLASSSAAEGSPELKSPENSPSSSNGANGTTVRNGKSSCWNWRPDCCRGCRRILATKRRSC